MWVGVSIGRFNSILVEKSKSNCTDLWSRSEPTQKIWFDFSFKSRERAGFGREFNTSAILLLHSFKRDWVGDRQYFSNIINACIQHCDESSWSTKWGIQYSFLFPDSPFPFLFPVMGQGNIACIQERLRDRLCVCVCVWERERERDWVRQIFNLVWFTNFQNFENRTELLLKSHRISQFSAVQFGGSV